MADESGTSEQVTDGGESPRRRYTIPEFQKHAPLRDVTSFFTNCGFDSNADLDTDCDTGSGADPFFD